MNRYIMYYICVYMYPSFFFFFIVRLFLFVWSYFRWPDGANILCFQQPKFTIMVSSTGGSTSVSSPAIEEDAHNPFWRYVTKQQKLGDGWGNVS